MYNICYRVIEKFVREMRHVPTNTEPSSNASLTARWHCYLNFDFTKCNLIFAILCPGLCEVWITAISLIFLVTHINTKKLVFIAHWSERTRIQHLKTKLKWSSVFNTFILNENYSQCWLQEALRNTEEIHPSPYILQLQNGQNLGYMFKNLIGKCTSLHTNTGR